MEHLNMTTPDGAQLNLDALYRICPSCFTESKDEEGNLKRVVDFAKLKALLGDNAVEDAPEAYDFTWVGKRAAQREASAPINKTLRPCPEESVDWAHTQNLYIEGDNLEVLKLLQNSYMGKVKMIYIDPPYNTGNDFVYHDDFAVSAEEYDEHNINEEGERFRKNTDSNGRFHSDWCSMMYARLMVARTLLREDGVIFISIDEHEQRNLRNICDEVFNENNFISQISWVSKSGGSGDERYLINAVEYILVYSKNKSLLTLNKEDVDIDDDKYNLVDEFVNTRGRYVLKKLDFRMTSLHYTESLNFPVSDPDGKELWPGGESYRQDGGWNWRWSKSKIQWGLENGFLEFKKNNKGKWTLNSKQYQNVDNKGNAIDRRIAYKNFISSSEYNTTQGSRMIVELFGSKIFEYAKPVELIKRLIEIGCDGEEDIVVDFFSGSASTAHAVMEYNIGKSSTNRYIMIQLPEKTTDGSEANKAGYDTICELAKKRIQLVGSRIKESHPSADTGFRVFKCDTSNMKDVYFAPKDYNQQMVLDLKDNIKEDRTDLDLLFDCMLRWGVELSLPIASKEVGACTIHNVNDGDLVACFTSTSSAQVSPITEEVIDAIAEMNPLRVVFRDSSFTEASQKMNLFELFKQKCHWSDSEVKNNVRVI